MLDLRALAIFVKVGERRSFIRAARDLGITQSGVSNAVSRLEDQLGLRLLARTTRSVALTEDGAAFFERCRRILADLDEAEQVLTQARIAPRGTLRLDVPVSFGRLKVVPLLGAFQAQFPELRLDVTLTDRYVDLVEEGIDVTMRIGDLQDSSLIARRLAESQLRITGSPDYFRRHGRPETPEDLAHHRCLPFTIRDSRVARDWYLRRDGVDRPFSPNATISFNDGSAIVTAACAGFGLIQMNDYTTDDAVAAGDLETVLDAHNPSPTPIWVVYPAGRHLSPKVRAFADFMAAQLRTPAVNRGRASPAR
jgi:LysR family transcriptional regulator, regulator for bpeEF and oprC